MLESLKNAINKMSGSETTNDTVVVTAKLIKVGDSFRDFDGTVYTVERIKTDGDDVYVKANTDSSKANGWFDRDKYNVIKENTKVAKLKEQLIGILTELNNIKPVQFHDVDCDDCVFNFSDVKVDETDDRVYIEIAMYHDNLPVHAEHPLYDSKGKAILPAQGGSPQSSAIDRIAGTMEGS